MSVNLSMHDLHDKRLPGTIAELLEAENVAPAGLKVENNESTIMADAQRALELLGQLRSRSGWKLPSTISGPVIRRWPISSDCLWPS